MSKEKDAKEVSARKKPKVDNTKEDLDDLFPEVEKLKLDQIYPKICDFYDNLAVTNSAEDDWDEYRSVCSHIVSVMDEIVQLKTDKPDNWEASVRNKRREVPLSVIHMKKLNRCEKLRIKSSREKTSEKKQEIESLHLKLQNTLCEIQHISNEVDKCMQLRNMNFGIELVPVEEFYKEAPKNISAPEITRTDEHKRQLARLEWELKQRKDKASFCDELEKNRKKVIGEIKQKEEVLESIKPLVSSLVEAAKPLSEKLKVVSKTEPLKKCNLASYLPDELFFLYVQADAYREACDKKLIITIAGDVEAAKHFKLTPLGPVDNKMKMLKNTPESQAPLTLEEKQKRIMSTFPLSVKMKIILKDRNSICLNFNYLVYLKLLSVIPRVSLHRTIHSNAAHPLLLDQTILNELFPGDTGLTSPNPTTYYLLKKVGLDKVDIDVEHIGLIYHWVQKLGGIDFLKGSERSDRSIQLTQATIPVVIKNIRQRLTSRLTLASQLISFESGNVTIPASMAGIKLTAVLKTWLPINYPEFTRRPFTKFLSSCVSPNDFFYRAIIQKLPAIIEALVVIKPNYPTSAPIFVFQLLLNEQKLNSRNNHHIRDIEREVNVYWDELVAKNRSPLYLLSGLLHRALVSIEILLTSLYPDLFPDSGKTLLCTTRGRTRSLPFKYVPIGDGIFVQR